MSARPWDTCVKCGKAITCKADGTLGAHGKPNNRCRGSGQHGIAWRRTTSGAA